MGSLWLALQAKAQTILWSEDFNGKPDWSVNTSDLSGTTSGFPNKWIINASYIGGFATYIIPDVPDQPSAIAGYPYSQYLHIISKAADDNEVYNASYIPVGAHSYFAYPNSSFSTLGQSDVTLTFWWLCNGDAFTFGQVYYRTSASGSWTAISSPATFSGSTVWSQATITDAAWNEQPYLQFAFRFQHDDDDTTYNPPFCIDEIKVTGDSPPVATFTLSDDSTCFYDCITATTSTVADSYSWDVIIPFAGTFPIPDSDTPFITFCANTIFFTAIVPMTATLQLTVYNSSGMDTETHDLTILPQPQPFIGSTGDSVYSFLTMDNYQWYFNGSIIPGADSSSVIAQSGGYYQLYSINEYGCSGISDSLYAEPESVITISANSNNYLLRKEGDQLVISTGNTRISNATVIVCDLSGKTLTSINWSAGQKELHIDNNQWPAGFYFIRVSGKDGYTVIRWLAE